MFARLARQGAAVCLPVLLSSGFIAQAAMAAEEGRRQIEEVVVTAERKESTVSDTSISITAFSGQMLEDFGIRNQEDLQNYIPAAVIEPYDMAVRGVGRNFRTLGGDPGIATYLNGVYSEDFGIASSEGGLFDIERIEVLRGPQGTLYGRNAIGGAINFVNKKPTQEFEGEARVIVGDYDTEEMYGMLSFPMVEDVLAARLTGTKRTRDGYHEDVSGPDINNYGDENYALSLLFTPTDTIEINMRGNERSYRRRVGNQGGSIVFNENGGTPDEITGLPRNSTALAFGYREVSAAQVNPLAKNFLVPGAPTFNFTNPNTGAALVTQRVRPGVDPAASSRGNRFFGHNIQQVTGEFGDLDSDDLKTDTSGLHDEYFDQQAFSFDVSWELGDVTAKYIFGYTDYFYDRTTDEELSSNVNLDDQFYVSQESEYASHELQFFFDVGDSVSVTTGVFAYDAKINQRGDFYSSVGEAKYLNPASYGPFAGLMASFFPNGAVEMFDAKGNFKRGQPATGGTGVQGLRLDFGTWDGDVGTRIPHGPVTDASTAMYAARTERTAYAAYTQGVWDINEQFALTLGVRWARDTIDAEENGWGYSEDLLFGLDNVNNLFTLPGPNDPPGTCNVAAGCVQFFKPTLFQYNAAIGAINPLTLQPTGLVPVAYQGIPTTVSSYRELDREDDEVTWRANLDWTPNDDTLLYISATTGHRSGGFNLANFSTVATYEPEKLLAYELGYKGQLLDNTLQINAALYFYDYEDVHTVGHVPNILLGSASPAVVAAPGAEMYGIDGDVLWLATDRITLGANWSYTPSEYTKSLQLINANDPSQPGSLFGDKDFNQVYPSINVQTDQRYLDIKGNQMLRVPEWKYGVFGAYMLPLGDNGKLDFLTSWSWIDEVYFSAFEDDIDKADSYARLDARVTWTSVDDSWVVAGFVNNALDEVGVRQIDVAGEGGNYLRKGATTDPRLYGVEVRYKFGAFR